MRTKEILKKIYPLLILLALGVLSISYGYLRVRTDYGYQIVPPSTDRFSAAITNETAETVTFTAPKQMTLDAVSLLFVDYAQTNTGGVLTVTARDVTSGQLLGGGEIEAAKIVEWQWQTVPLSGAGLPAGDVIELTVTARELPADTTLSFVLGKESESPALRLTTDLWDPFQKLFLVCAAAVLFLLIVSYVLLYLWQAKIEAVFLITFPVMALIFNLLVPAKLGPDESAHLNSVYKIAERIEGWESSAPDRSVLTVEEAVNGLTVEETGHDYYVKYYGWLSSRTDGQELTEQTFWGSQENPDLTYTPAALGIVLGRHLSLSAAGIIFTGRLFAFVPVFLLLLYTIHAMPFGKEMIFAITMLPTMLQESTTINADGIDIALSFALTAAVLRRCYGNKDRTRFLDYAVMLTTALILSRCKYGALVPLCLLPFLLFWKERAALKDRSDKERTIVAVAALLLPVICVVIGFFPLIHTTVRAYGETLWATHYTFSDILHDPLGVLFLLGSTIYYKMDFYLLSLAGTYLGWLNIILPQYLTLAMLATVLIAALPRAQEGQLFSAGARVLFLGIALLGAGFAVGGMLIGWTDVGADFIDGVQGRYFLPVLPVLLFSLRPKAFTTKEDGSVQRSAVLAAVFLQILIVTALFVRAQ